MTPAPATGVSDMRTVLVVLLVVVGAALLFWLAWWSSGRSRGLGYRRRSDGDGAEDYARLQADAHRGHMGVDTGGTGGPI